ncbi:hydroxymethylglutaryl-CoA synthase [Oceanivirga miroungae]|uniref:Hydroxymethylglutaryl-CoA synthase n=1 Tax=Oceanivirga miroungae TaxID=1130046 RepID=A0A6I8MBP0_9FUSO|nr:hydroxymethylglutaryl-CoA synthase [Oceanivirga miroungae]VWL84837.1 hydroxymethylglutaryl-CoA synthase [Oceanivirga miroungae]
MSVGIDKIGVYIPKYFLDIRCLAKARNVEEEKYTKGLMHDKMAISPVSQDIVSMGTMASLKILNEEDKKNIGLVIFATESSFDKSKAASTYIHSLLDLNPYCRTVEMKQACFSATAGILMARDYVKLNKNKKALVIASDIAKYEMKSPGESTQGSGSVAILISENPKIAEIEENSVSYTKDVMDFYRPSQYEYPKVDGKLSNEMYLHHLEVTYNAYVKEKNDTNFSNICFHVPYPKLALKAVKMVNKNLEDRYYDTVKLNSQVGNIYTGSLYLSLYSLLSNADYLKENDRIAMYSYGSGSVSEFFVLKLKKDFKKEKLDLENRIELSIEEYEKIFYEKEVEDKEYENCTDEKVYLKGIFDSKRKYVINGK